MVKGEAFSVLYVDLWDGQKMKIRSRMNILEYHNRITLILNHSVCFLLLRYQTEDALVHSHHYNAEITKKYAVTFYIQFLFTFHI